MGTTNWLYRVRRVGGQFLVVGQNGALYTSEDGTNSAARASGTTRWLNDVTFVDGTWFVVGTQGLLLSSSNLVNWASLPVPSIKSIYGATTYDGQLVLTGIGGIVLRNQVVPRTTPVDFLVGAPLVPIRLGPADWVDADVFNTPVTREKRYDLVMVANWGAHKRHAQLFRALRDIRDRRIRVLLVGFPWANRTAQDIRREAERYRNDLVEIEIVENVAQARLADYVGQSKVFVFLSRKEGDNKALVEAIFADVPAIVYDRTIGGAGSRINEQTGVFASDAEVSGKIRYMLDHFRDFTPRAWAQRHTGSSVATRVLNQALLQAVRSSGGRYEEPIVEKTNAPNLAYKDPGLRARFKVDYDYILACSRYGRTVEP